jgi:uncharacterized protein YaiE (UPF0345 family)
MKTKILFLFLAAAIFAGCSKDVLIENEVAPGPRLKNSSSSLANTPVSDAGVIPSILVGANQGGNITCEEAAAAFGVDGFAFTTGKVDYNGAFEGSFEGFTVTTDGTNVTWSFTAPEGYCLANMAVIVKGSADANVYFYGSELYGDSGLASPVNASGSSAGLSNLTFCYNLVPCETECEWIGETAWAAGERYTKRGNWATYTAYQTSSGADCIGCYQQFDPEIFCSSRDTECREELAALLAACLAACEASSGGSSIVLYAGQSMEAGTISFSAVNNGSVTITITLNAGWRFKNSAENVKVQDYATAPSGNPSPGLFLWKEYATGSTYSFDVPANSFYGIHVDVEWKKCD